MKIFYERAPCAGPDFCNCEAAAPFTVDEAVTQFTLVETLRRS